MHSPSYIYMLKNIIHSKIVKPFQSMRKTDDDESCVVDSWTLTNSICLLGVFRMKSFSVNLTSSYLAYVHVLCSPCLTHQPAATASRYFISCIYVEQWVIQWSCPVVPFIPAKNFRPWWRITDPLTFLKWHGTSAAWSKNFWLKVKILWLHDVMSGWPLNPKKSRMSHSKRAVATIAP